MLHTCPVCGRIFKRSDKRAKYCSMACYNKSKLKPPPVYVCERCKKPFPDPNYNRTRRFCSKSCKDKWSVENRPVLTCENCGKSFTSPRGHKVKPKFCSRSCWRSHAISSAKRLTCRQCGISFVNYAGNKNAQFCSMRCCRLFRGPTSIEKIVAGILDELQIAYIPQFSFEGFVYDFFIQDAGLFIECDGAYWHSLPGAKQRDMVKDKVTRKSGYKLLRLSQDVIENAPERCRYEVVKVLKAKH